MSIINVDDEIRERRETLGIQLKNLLMPSVSVRMEKNSFDHGKMVVLYPQKIHIKKYSRLLPIDLFIKRRTMLNSAL